MKVTLLLRSMIDSNMSKVKTGLIALTAIVVTIMILGVTSAFAQTVEEVEMCNEYSETTLSPQGITNAFLTTNKEAGIWVKINDPPDDVTFKFYYQDNGVEKEYTGGYSKVDIIPKEGANWGIAFTTIDIEGKTPSFNPGVWTAKIFIDGEVVKIKEFSIIDYASIVSSIASIQETVTEIVEEKNQVVDDYNNLVTDYGVLVQQYNDLEDTTVSEFQLMELNNDYDDLQDDYDDLKAAQESTRTMMYGAIVVALIAVIVAVYFGLMKK